MLLYIVWDPMKEIIRGIQPPVWYSVLFALGFIISYQLVTHFFKSEGKKVENVDTLTVYMVLATIIGARLGHLVFYEPQRFLEDPLMFFRTWEGGLASHGGALGILVALFLYRTFEVEASLKPFRFKFRKHKRAGQSYLWIVDRIVIATALTVALIRVGNFVNSEIIGKPTESSYGVVFGRVAEVALEDNSFLRIERAEASEGERTETTEPGIVPVDIKITFAETNLTEEEVKNRIESSVKDVLTGSYVREHYAEPAGLPIRYELTPNGRKWMAVVHTYGISRHPAQLYEAATLLILFIILLGVWYKYKERTPEGLLFGIFLVWSFGLRWFHETLKEPQVAFEETMTYNMGQLLSIPMFLLGVFILIRTFMVHKKSKNNT